MKSNNSFNMRKVSKKQSANLRQYKKVRESYLESNTNCEAKLNGCTYESTEIHHKKGRIGSLLQNDSYFLAVYRNCHHYIELNTIEAKEKGFSLSRLEK